MKLKTFILCTVSSLILLNNAYGQDYTKIELNPDGWPIPDVHSAKAKSTTTKSLGTVEAVFEVFITPENTVFNRISTKGEIWAYLVDTDGKKPMEYILIRSNRLSDFDTKVPASEEVPIPEWVSKLP